MSADVYWAIMPSVTLLPTPDPDEGPGQKLIGSEGGGLISPRGTLLGSNTLQPLARRLFTDQVGRSVAVPKQQVDRQISRLIKRFD